jgi:hypothetical protein
MVRTGVHLLLFSLIFNISTSYSQLHEVTEFSGIYSDNKRVGFNKTTFREDGDVLTINEHSKLKMILLGAENYMEITSKYILKNGKLSDFEFKMYSGAVKIESKGTRTGNKIAFKTTTQSGNSEFEMEIDKEPMVNSYLNKWIAENGLEVGKKYETYIFEPSMLLIGSSLNDLRAEIEVVGKEKIELPAGSFDTYKYTVSFNGAVSNLWITDKGELIKDVSSLGLTAIKEKEDLYKNENLQRVDITEKTAISASQTIDNPRKLDRLEVKLSGLESLGDFNLNDRNRQFLSDNLLVIKTEDISSFKYLTTIPNKEQVVQTYLSPTNLIQSKNDNIIRLANNIIGKTNHPIDKVRLINTWIYNNLDKKPTISIPNALDVLSTKSGDCNEHTVLFTALTRSVEIPTKIILGIVYLDGKFYYHAWNEVFLGKWVSVDSTLNQLPVDASHIKFLEGDISRSSEIMKLVGKLGLQIIDAS